MDTDIYIYVLYMCELINPDINLHLWNTQI